MECNVEHCFYVAFAESASSVKTKCIQIDFGDDLEIYDKISSELAGLELGVLGSIAAFYLASETIDCYHYTVNTTHMLHKLSLI